MKSLLLAVGLALTCASHAVAQGTTTFRGTVRDSATGRAVSGAIVELVGPARRHVVRTDEVGEFQVDAVVLGDYRMVVRRIGFAPLARELSVMSGMKPRELVLSPVAQALREVRVRGEGTGVFGQVGRAEDLAPIPGAVVQVAGTRDSVIADSAGVYYVPVKTPGRYMVRVRAPGFAEEMFIVDVKRNQVADGSRLLDAGSARHIPAVLWQDFDQRMSWRTRGGAALLAGSDVRRAGTSITGALKASGQIVASGLRLGSTVCVFVNGQPSPQYILDAIPPDEINAIEAYSGRGGAVPLLAASWPRGMRCSETGERTTAAGGQINYLVIWTK